MNRKITYYLSLLNPLFPIKSRILLRYGKNTEKYYDFLEKSQWWSRGEIENYQNEKLRKLIRHSYANIPYYKELFDKNNLAPSEIRTANDLEKVPILTKQLIRDNLMKITVKASSDKYTSDWARTGASTGEPMSFLNDSKSKRMAWASFWRFYRWMGYEWGDKSVWLWGAPIMQEEKQKKLYVKVADWFQHSFIPQIFRFDAFSLDDLILSQYAKKIGSINPHILRGYVNAVVKLARFCKENGYNGIRPKAITTTAEMLHSSDRRILETQFGCEVFDQYACGECMGMAFECEVHEGLHVTDEHCLIEFVDKNNERVRPGKKGKLILTDLDNHVMPFIRYENGDVGSQRVEECVCGRGLSMINNVEGRISDLIVGANGKVVHGEFFTHLLSESGWFERYKLTSFEVVQNRQGEINWFLVCNEEPSTRSIEQLLGKCSQYLGSIQINMKIVDKVPSCDSYKRRFTRSEINTF